MLRWSVPVRWASTRVWRPQNVYFDHELPHIHASEMPADEWSRVPPGPTELLLAQHLIRRLHMHHRPDRDTPPNTGLANISVLERINRKFYAKGKHRQPCIDVFSCNKNKMLNQIRDAATIDNDNFPYIFEKNVSIPLKSSSGLVRANVYRPQDSSTTPVPVLVTYGPYGKDIYYGE